MGAINSFVIEQSRIVVTSAAIISLIAIVGVLAVITQFRTAAATASILGKASASNVLNTFEVTDQPTLIINQADSDTSAADSSNSVSSSVNVSQSNGTAQIVAPSGATVTINGQPVTVPQNGSTQQTVSSQNGNSSMNVTIHSSNSGATSGYNRSSVNIRSNSTVRQTP